MTVSVVELNEADPELPEGISVHIAGRRYGLDQLDTCVLCGLIEAWGELFARQGANPDRSGGRLVADMEREFWVPSTRCSEQRAKDVYSVLRQLLGVG